MDKENYDVVVLGGGTGGYATAFRARELGLSVAIIEREKLGGTCLHRGCVPTKALLHAAELLEQVKAAPRFGIHAQGVTVAWDEVMKAKEEVVDRIYGGLQGLAKARRVEIIHGAGRINASEAVEVEDGGQISFRYLVLATGSRPKTVPGAELDGDTVITSDEALRLAKVPQSVIVLGGGFVGVEFASMWASFGADVTVVEMAPRLMMQEDAEIATALAKALEARGIKLYLGARFESLEKGDKLKVEVLVDGEKQVLEAEKLMVAVGRGAVTDGLTEAGIQTADGFVKVDARLRTTRPNVYAVGDLLPTPQLAHAAFAEGIFVAEEIAGLNPEEIDYDAVPRCVYSFPEVAGVGLTEEAARAQGYDVKIVRLPFEINARAKIAGATIGETKVVVEAGGRVLGVHMIGARVTEMISEAMLVTGWQAQPEDVARLIHPHPTYSEAIGEAGLKLAGKPLHTL